jgi:predicted glycosyltransferase involved in capsule biosynthesis
MAFWKADLLKINGHNEDFTGWGKEDNDIAVRLLNTGLGLRFIKFGAIVYHLFHKHGDASNVKANELLLHRSIDNRVTFIHNGIDKYPSSP